MNNAPSTVYATGETRLARVVQFPLVRLVAALVHVILAVAVVGLLLRWTGVDATWVRAILSIVAAHLAYAGYVRWYERRPVAELDRWSAGRGLLIGTGGGLSLVAGVVLVLWGFGAVTFASGGGFPSVWGSALIAFPVAYLEEIIFRGIIYRLVEEWLGTWLALAASGVIFGAMHMANPAASIVAALALALEAGVLLGALYVLTRRLWVPIGVHLGWNFGVGGVFGLHVSGTANQGAISASLAGPSWLTGGAFGVEASVPAVVLCLLAAIGVLAIAARRRHIVAPSWRRSPARTRRSDLLNVRRAKR